MLCLVTGAGGFLGGCIARQLVARGDKVRELGRGDYPELQSLGVELVRGDLRDRERTIAACAGVDAVFHVAARSGIWGPWSDYYGVNVTGTEHVLVGCRRHGVGRLVYTSSPSVTFDGRDQRGIDESAPYASRWLCHYPHTKAIAEQQVLAANGVGGLWTCALRPHLIWGPGDPHLVPRLVQRARAGQLRRIGDGQNMIDMVYVDNAAAAHLQATDALSTGSPVCGRAYFISQGEPVNCWQWIDRLLALAGLPPVERAIPFRAAWMAGAASEAFHRVACPNREPRMTRFLAAQLGRSHYFDIRRARDDFGYSPTISIADGMDRLGRHLAAEAAANA
jgi:2-alkyl-3-oxoalkanoate reductase